MKIKVLPDTVINQIAAGEVVERPASVVRELVDNAVDAGATDIFIAVEAGGHSRLKVRDNGCGMSRDEAILAFERHATSKVSVIEDLNALSTLGFRGEALASIAAVSKVKLTTRSGDSEVGTSVVFRGGTLVDVHSCAWGEGTEFEVEHLFFNTPARRKFLKSPRTELGRIRTWVLHSSLARPHVRYRLVADGVEVVNLPSVSTVAARGENIFPGDLIPVLFKEGGIVVEGRVGHPGLALADATGLVLLINGRLVTDKIMLRAVREGYDSMLKDREFPIGYLSLTLPPDEVDVNVHPQKSEVRFRHPDQIFAVVRAAVLMGVRNIKRPMVASYMHSAGSSEGREVAAQGCGAKGPESAVASRVLSSFAATELVPAAEQRDTRDMWPVPLSKPAPVTPSFETTIREQPQPTFFDSFPPAGQPRVVAESEVSYHPRTETGPAVVSPLMPQSFRFSSLRYVGQILQCYLVCELAGEHLVVVDMHAAHERVNYNKIRAERAARTLVVQKLLIPEQVSLTEEQVILLMEQQDVLKELAFEVSQVSPSEVLVSGVPSIVAHLQCDRLLKEFAAEPVTAGWRERLDERIDHMAARLACHASVRSGDIMKKEESYALLAQLDEAMLAGACPHGRPVVAEFSRATVERWFGRDR